MPPPLFLDPREIDLGRVAFGPEEIRKCNPHRHEMELLHSILAYRPEDGLIIGEHRTTDDAFWVRGHIPGRPLFPGVLMVELAAQLCSFYWRQQYPEIDKFFGFGGIQDTAFRGTVGTNERLVVVGKSLQVKPRRAIFATQGFVGERMVFNTTIKGMLV